MNHRTQKNNANTSNVQHFVAKKKQYMWPISGVSESGIRSILEGTLVESHGMADKNELFVTESNDPKWAGTTWRCHSNDLIPVSPEIAKFLATVPAKDRVLIARNTQLCNEISDVKHYVAKKEQIMLRATGNCESNVSPLLEGTLVESHGTSEKNKLLIHVKDPSDPKWTGTTWYSNSYDIIPVSADIAKFLIPVPPKDRVSIASNVQLCNDIVEKVEVNSRVRFMPKSGNSTSILATVKYIGPLVEKGDGYFFILELMEKTEFFTAQYFNSVFTRGISATIANILPVKESIDRGMKKSNTFSPCDILEPKVLKEPLPSNSMKKNSQKDDLMSAMEKNTWISDTRNNNNDSLLTQDLHLFGPSKSTKTANFASEPRGENWSTLETCNYSYPEALEKDDSSKFRSGQNTSDLKVGSSVQVSVDKDQRKGIVKWIGSPPGTVPGKLMVAVELDDKHPLAADGCYNGVKYFSCRPQRGYFTDLKQCHQYDPTIEDRTLQANNSNDHDGFESQVDEVIEGVVSPISVQGNLDKICGKYRGIQGHHNSCYLDATLFSMFTFTSVFDNLLYRPPTEKDCNQYVEVQRVLREEIVNPLRKNTFVKYERVMKLRTLLEQLSSISGLTSEEKDPEEFLTSLVAQILNAEPFLKLSSGQEAYHYQLFVEKNDDLNLPSVQQLLEQSFFTSNIRLKEVPSCFIIQMPRFGKSYKMYKKILPTLLLDITDIVEGSLRQCTVCGGLAQYECKECYEQRGSGLESIAFCCECLKKAHSHENRLTHDPKELTLPVSSEFSGVHGNLPRLYMELSAVVCIETSHYVSFVKCGSGQEAPWCFFDSMADRKGEQGGYNIPEMVPCPDFPFWLSEEGANKLTTLTDDHLIPEHAKRLLCDAYMCMYQSSDVMMYK